MARKLKPYKVDSVRVHGSGDVVVYLDREEKDFFATVGLAIVRAPTARECKEKAIEAIEAGLQTIEWTREIGVSVETSDGWNRGETETELRLAYDRWQRAENINGDVISRPFDDEDVPVGSDFSTMRSIDRSDPRCFWDTVLPYDDDVWNGLVAIDEAIETLGRQLTALLDQDHAEKVLTRIAKDPSEILKLGSGKK